MKLLRKLLKFLLSLVLIVLFLLLGAAWYLSTHKKDVGRHVETWLAGRQKGAFHFGAIDVDVFRRFPAVSFTINNLSITDSISVEGSPPVLSAQKVRLLLPLQNALRGKIQIQSLIMEDGALFIRTDSCGYNNMEGLRPEIGEKKDTASPDLRGFVEEEMKIALQNFSFHIRDEQKNKRYTGRARRLTTFLSSKESALETVLDLDLIVHKMGFNLERGTFFNGAILKGKCRPKIDLKNKEINIPGFDLQIDDQRFFTEATFQLFDTVAYHIELKNEKALFQPSIKLLSQNIQEKLQAYDLKKAFEVGATIKGYFLPGDNPRVSARFAAADNEVALFDSIQFQDVSLQGRLVNRAYDDPECVAQEDKKNFLLVFEKLAGAYKGANFTAIDAYLRSTPEAKTYIDLRLEAQGKPDQLNEILQNDAFFFRKGKFFFQANFAGDATSPEVFLNQTQASLVILQTEALYRPTKLLTPIDRLELTVKNRDANLISLRTPLSSGGFLKASGQIKNFASLLLGDQKGSVSSSLNIRAEKLNLDDFLAVVDKLEQKKNKEPSEKSRLYETLNGIYEKFNPRLAIAIDRFEYRHFSAQRLQTKLYFESGDLAALEDASFEFNKGKATIDGKVYIPKPSVARSNEESIKIDLRLNSGGDAELFNELFDNKTYWFTAGKYIFEGRLRGDAKQFDQILQTAAGRLKISDAKIRYTPKKIIFPINIVDLSLGENKARLNRFELRLKSGELLSVQGKLNNFASLLRPDTSARVQSTLAIYAKKLDFNDFIHVFEPSETEGAIKPDQELIKETVKTIGKTFQPELNLRIDAFRYHKFQASQVKARLYFDPLDKLNLANTGFAYANGKVRLNASLDMSKAQKILFSANFKTSSLPVGNLMETFDFFGLETLRQAEKIEGDISIDSELDVLIKEEGGFDPNTIKGFVFFKLEDARLKNFTPLQKVANKVFRKSRFEDVRFAPISDTLFINQRTVEIPQLEIRSTAFDFFIEGRLDYDNQTNIWASVPLKNLNRRDIANIPDKKGYIAAGRKFFVQAIDDGSGKLEYKLHLNNRKLYKERGMLRQYREARKREKKARRQGG